MQVNDSAHTASRGMRLPSAPVLQNSTATRNNDDAPVRGAMWPTILEAVFERVDGTTLARASEVCWRWRQVATLDRLWRRACVAERPRWLAPAQPALRPPSWAIERPAGSSAAAPPRSWRQAYRLLAMLEHGRPYGQDRFPEVMPLPDQVPLLLNPEEPVGWSSPGEVWDALLPTFGHHRDLERLLFGTMPTWRRKLVFMGDLAAVRGGSGDVLLAWREQGQPRTWLLPLRARGCLASQVKLTPRRTGDPPGVGNVDVVTRSGHRWLHWRDDVPEAPVELPGKSGRIVRVAGRPVWLAWDWPNLTYSQFGICDLETGTPLQMYSESRRMAGAALLTEFGPLVGMEAGLWHARVLWSTQANVLAPNPPTEGPQQPWHAGGLCRGNRPQRLQAPAESKGARLERMALCDQVPGRVLLWWSHDAERRSAGTPGYVDGWGGVGDNAVLHRSLLVPGLFAAKSKGGAQSACPAHAAGLAKVRY